MIQLQKWQASASLLPWSPTKTGKKRRDLDPKETTTTTTKKCWSWWKDQWSCFIQKWVIELSYSEPSTKEQAVEHGFMRRPTLPDTPKSAKKEKACIWKILGESPLRRGNIIWTKGLVKYYATAFEPTDVMPTRYHHLSPASFWFLLWSLLFQNRYANNSCGILKNIYIHIAKQY